MFQGSLVALVTPMNPDGSIDTTALKELIEWHIRSKTDGLVIAGTTGEGCTLHEEEAFELFSFVVKEVAGRVPVIAGTGTNSTEKTLKATLSAEKAGVQAALIVTPYYNKPTQDGLYKHYKTIAENTQLPIILYNVPTRTSCDLLPETAARLAELPRIIGIKEASAGLDRMLELIERCPPSFLVFSGNDISAMDIILKGGRGVISVTANVAPLKMAELCQAAREGDKKKAEKINEELMGLHNKLFVESNPIPTKWALHQMGLIGEGIRLPLTTLDPRFHQEVNQAMQQAGVTL